MNKECREDNIYLFKNILSALRKLVLLQSKFSSTEYWHSNVISVAENIGKLRFAHAVGGKVAAKEWRSSILLTLMKNKENIESLP
jgi:hypothetical protein